MACTVQSMCVECLKSSPQCLYSPAGIKCCHKHWIHYTCSFELSFSCCKLVTFYCCHFFFVTSHEIKLQDPHKEWVSTQYKKLIYYERKKCYWFDKLAHWWLKSRKMDLNSMLAEVLPHSCDASCKLDNQRNTFASGLNNSVYDDT